MAKATSSKEAASKDIAQDIAKMSFEEALSELEAIVSEIESGHGELDRSIGAYERGIQLKKHCEAKLREAQARVEKIVPGAGGKIELEPAGDE